MCIFPQNGYESQTPLALGRFIFTYKYIVFCCLCFCYFHVVAEHIGAETINSLAAAHNIMRIPVRQTVLTWELESSITAATHRPPHCTLGNCGQPTFSRVHCQTSLCEFFKYIHGEMPCSLLPLYRILYMVWFCIQYLTLHDTLRRCFHKGEVAGGCLL